MNKELSRRGLDKKSLITAGKGIGIFLLVVVPHILLNRIASSVTIVSPIVGGFIFAAAMVGLKDAKKKFE